MSSPFDSSTYDGIIANSRYHIEPLPGEISETDAVLDVKGQEGWDLVAIHGRNAVFKSAVIAGAGFNDAFGRQRMSLPYTLGDYKHLYDIDQNFINYNVSGSTHTFNKTRASVTLATSASIGSRAVHQTKMYHNYMPGKSQHILSSFVFGAAQPGVIKRTGYFDDYNGIFFEQDATGSLNWVIRSSTNGTGSVQENRVSQVNWNINPMTSGAVILDITKSQLVSLDFQWLGIGRVRCGIVVNGEVYLTHVFDHSNKTDVVYMSDPNLPVRCEIINTTTTTGSMEQICATVVSEGGYEESGVTWGKTSPSTRTVLGSVATGSLLMAIRLKDTYNGLPNRAFVRLEDVSIYSEDQTVRYSIVRLNSGSVTGGTWISVDNASVVEFNTGSMTYVTSSTHELSNGFCSAGTVGGGGGAGVGFATPSQRFGSKNKINYISQNFNSTSSDMYGIIATNLTSTNTDVAVGMVWKEVY